MFQYEDTFLVSNNQPCSCSNRYQQQRSTRNNDKKGKNKILKWKLWPIGRFMAETYKGASVNINLC